MSELAEQLRLAAHNEEMTGPDSWAALLTQAADKIERLQAIADKYRDACQFAIEKCVSRTAGNSTDPFAWLPQRDWDDFVSMTAEAARKTK